MIANVVGATFLMHIAYLGVKTASKGPHVIALLISLITVIACTRSQDTWLFPVILANRIDEKPRRADMDPQTTCSFTSEA